MTPAKAASRSRKAWVNKMLETNPVPTLWLSNSIDDIDPAFLRRFDMVVEVVVPPAAARAGLLERAAGGLLPSDQLRRITRCEHLAPAVVTRAVSVVAAIGDAVAPEQRAAAVCRLVEQSLSAQRLPPLPALGDPAPYSPEFSNADADLLALADGVAASDAGVRLCLYGPPGTGKTAWGRWLAERLGRPLIVKRASDLLGQYVGQNEKNVRNAFAAARVGGAVLLIDEVDSFIQSREGAQSQWQVSMVNEMLTQMEAFDGLFVATTNLLDAIDSAALRRFDLKVRFDALSADQAVALFARYAATLGLPPPDHGLLERARQLNGATPGDFAVLARRQRFRKARSAAELLDGVRAEVELRRGRHARPIGFVSA